MPGWGSKGRARWATAPPDHSRWVKELNVILRLCLITTFQVPTGGEQICVWGKKGKAALWDCNPTKLEQGPCRLSVAGVGVAQALFRLFLSFGDAACPQQSSRGVAQWHFCIPGKSHPQCSGAFLSARCVKFRAHRGAKHSESHIPLLAAIAGLELEKMVWKGLGGAYSSPQSPKAGSDLLMGILFCLTCSQNHLGIKIHALPGWSLLVLTWALTHRVVNSPSVMQGKVIYKILLLREAG